jgi:TolB-like protein
MPAAGRGADPPERYRVDDLLLDVDACVLSRGQTPIALPPRTFELLVELVRRHPKVARREELMEALWRGEDVLDEALSQRVMLLRKALSDTAEKPRYIALVRKWGYRMVAPVEKLGPEHVPGPSVGEGDEPGVAVLPFLDLSPARDQEYLCEGIAEEIINALTKVPGLRVIARSSCFAVGRMELDIRETGARLGVGTVLEGSVRREGGRVRVTAQLVNARDGSHLWSERYDRDWTDVFPLEDEIADAVASRLRLALGARARPPQRAVDPDAHAAYLEGRSCFAKGTPEALARAGACYARALERDPGFALAYDSLAELHWYLGFFGNMPPREAFSVSTWHALRALELDDTLAQTHALLAMLRKELDYNWPEVNRELDRALELAPESPQVRLRHAISGLLPHGRMSEATAELEGVLRNDPLSLIVRWWLAVMLYLGRRPDRMAEEGRRMIALEPSHFLGHWVLGIALDECADKPAAVAAMEKAHELSGGIPFTLGFLAFVQGRSGRQEDARRVLAAAREAAETGYLPPSVSALGHVGLGEWDDALRWLDCAIETRDPMVMPIKTYPFLDPVRGDPRLRALLEKMHLA